jgi:hypothetical protein
MRFTSCFCTAAARNPRLATAARTFFFSGKAAPAYQFAKARDQFINNLGATLQQDPIVRGRLRVDFRTGLTGVYRRKTDSRQRCSSSRFPQPFTKQAARAHEIHDEWGADDRHSAMELLIEMQRPQATKFFLFG